jgi:hypothetical protein
MRRFVSVQHDRSPDDVHVGPWIPTQRTESTGQPPPSPAPSPTAPLPPDARPAGPANEATVVLPVFVTGKKPEPPAVQRAAETKLPSSERGMLLFVAALLGLGTLAVVTMMGFGLGGASTTPKPPVARTAPPSPVAAAPLPSPADSPSPSPSPSPSSASPSPSRSPRRSPSPTATLLGTLSNGAVVGYCKDTNNGMPWPPGQNNTWACVANRGQRQEFTPTDVCRWQFHDGGARAVVGDLATPSTWRCYT